MGSFGAIGDNGDLMHEPAAAVLVLTRTTDVEELRLIHQLRLLGKATICKVNDDLPDVRPWN